MSFSAQLGAVSKVREEKIAISSIGIKTVLPKSRIVQPLGQANATDDQDHGQHNSSAASAEERAPPAPGTGLVVDRTV
jgi:hypothetical protein